MAARYLLRLDDACPTMNAPQWRRMEEILDHYGIRPIVAIIPSNANPLFAVRELDPLFWERAREWQRKGWAIGLHGFDHVSLRPACSLRRPSEFAGVVREMQREKIRRGWRILTGNGVEPTVWVAPWHTFDRNTLQMLREETSIRIVSDGVAFAPYAQDDFSWIPVQLWGYVPFPFGTFTICLHPETMTERQFRTLEATLARHASSFVAPSDMPVATRTRTLPDMAFAMAHACYAGLGYWKERLLRPTQ